MRLYAVSVNRVIYLPDPIDRSRPHSFPTTKEYWLTAGGTWDGVLQRGGTRIQEFIPDK